MTDNEKTVFLRAIETYGEDAQMKMLLEEMSELQKEICKQWRGAENIPEIAEEIADVEIMLDQVKLICACGRQVECWRHEKIGRLFARLEAHKHD